MGKKLEDQVLIMQASNDKIASDITQMKSHLNKRYSESTKMRSDMKQIKTIITHMISQKQHSSPYNLDSPKAQDPSTTVPANKRDTPLEGGHSTKIGGMWNLKHEISSPKSYELLIKTELKCSTALYLDNLYNHINLCHNAVTRTREDLLSAYQSIKIYSYFWNGCP